MEYEDLTPQQEEQRQKTWEVVLDGFCQEDEEGNRPCDHGCPCDRCQYDVGLNLKYINLMKDRGIVLLDEEIEKLNINKVAGILNTPILTSKIDQILSNEANKGEVISVYTIVGGSEGVYIPKLVCETFGIDKCTDKDSNDYWEEFEEVESLLTKASKIAFSDVLLKHCNATIYVGTNESDGSFDLLLDIDE